MAEGTTSVTVTNIADSTYAQMIETAHHTITADTTAENGGQETGPTPFEILMASLGACTGMTMRMYAVRKNWPLEKTVVSVTHRAETAAQADGTKANVDLVTLHIEMQGALDDTQRARLLEIAGKCPVHRFMTNNPQIVTTSS
jgi:putative redox protein